MLLAPVALFVYNRPDHTRRTLEALRANTLARETPLHVFSDAPRDAAAEAGVRAVRHLVAATEGFASVTIVQQSRNLGLAGSVTRGVTDLCDRFGRVIVLEDDIETGPYFLDYMNAALDRYGGDETVMHVSAYMFNLADPNALPETFFHRCPSCWGWGTWKRAWDAFEPDVHKLLPGLRPYRVRKAFDIGGTFNYFRMLERQAERRIDSWAIRWYASVFLKGGLSLFPSRSLVANIGNDGSGQHGYRSTAFDVPVGGHRVTRFAPSIVESPEGVEAIMQFYRSIRPPVLRRGWNRMGRALGLAGSAR